MLVLVWELDVQRLLGEVLVSPMEYSQELCLEGRLQYCAVFLRHVHDKQVVLARTAKQQTIMTSHLATDIANGRYDQAAANQRNKH